MGIFTLSWEDIYDYYRCPKIIAFKTANLKTRTLPSYSSEFSQFSREVGIAGEFLVEHALPKIMEGEKINIENIKKLAKKIFKRRNN